MIHMTELVYKQIGGLGNFFIHLTSMDEKCTKLHESVYEHEVSNCITINGFTRVSYEGIQPEAPIYINPYTYNNIHNKIRNIIKPTTFMEELISKHEHILDDVSCGISIRRGTYAVDSVQYSDGTEQDVSHYFCSDEGLKNFEKIIEKSPGKVFVSSDSTITINTLVSKFGEKIKTLNTKTFTIAMKQDQKPSMKDYQNSFLKFFILSKCPKLYLTGGRGDMVGFSTYAYMASIYGSKPIEIVFNKCI
jgi:hypothetical protein